MKKPLIALLASFAVNAGAASLPVPEGAPVPLGANTDPFVGIPILEQHILITKLRSKQAGNACQAYAKGNLTRDKAKTSNGIAPNYRYHNRIADQCMDQVDAENAEDSFFPPLEKLNSPWVFQQENQWSVIIAGIRNPYRPSETNYYYMAFKTEPADGGWNIKSCINTTRYTGNIRAALGNACGAPWTVSKSRRFVGDVNSVNATVQRLANEYFHAHGAFGYAVGVQPF